MDKYYYMDIITSNWLYELGYVHNGTIANFQLQESLQFTVSIRQCEDSQCHCQNYKKRSKTGHLQTLVINKAC